MTRREIRECAFIIVFEMTMRDDTPEELYELAEETGLEVNDKVMEIVAGVLEHDEELCGIVSKYSEKRTLQRIPKISLAILKIAIYEALYDELTPVNAAINEAVLLSGAYSYKEETSFVNGVLSSFAKNISGEQNG